MESGRPRARKRGYAENQNPNKKLGLCLRACATNEKEFYGIVDVAENPGEDSHGCGAKN